MYSKTIDYYNENATNFSTNTFEIRFSETQDEFLSFLNKGARILDFGCGSGRDTKYFLDKGYQVSATDGSKEICDIATKNTGISVKQMMFNELETIEEYDGIWACASILHLPLSDLKVVLTKISRALRKHGILYTSFKYSEFEGMKNGRYFTDMTEAKMKEVLKDIAVFEVQKQWITFDVRPERDDEKWLNLILRKS